MGSKDGKKLRSLNSSKSLYMESGMWPGRDDYD